MRHNSHSMSTFLWDGNSIIKDFKWLNDFGRFKFTTVSSFLASATVSWFFQWRWHLHPQGWCFSTYIDASSCRDDISFLVFSIILLPTVMKSLFMSGEKRKREEGNTLWKNGSHQENGGHGVSDAVGSAVADWRCSINSVSIFQLSVLKNLLVAMYVEWAAAGLTVGRWPKSGVTIVAR